MRPILRSLVFFLLLSPFLPRSADGIPVFARKYKTSCFTCHVSPPLLNEFGRRFQANGYVLPGTSENSPQAASETFPLGLIAQPMVMHTTEHDNLKREDNIDATTFSGMQVLLVSTASIAPHFSYYLAAPISIASGSSEISIETAHLIYRDVLGDASGSLNFRMGKFLLLVPFTPMFQLTGQMPIVYDGERYNPIEGRAAANEMVVSEPVFGVSAYGTNYDIGQGLRWELAFIGGNNSDVSLKEAHAFYAAVDQTFYLDNALLRIGGFAFGGSQAVSNSFPVESSMPGMPGMGGGATSELGGAWNNEILRYAIDAEITEPWMKRLTLFGLYMRGRDNNIDSLGGTFEMSGGMAGINAILLPEKLYAYARYDLMQMGEMDDKQTAIDVGLRFLPFPNVIVTGGFTSTIAKTYLDDGSTASSISTNTISAGILFGF